MGHSTLNVLVLYTFCNCRLGLCPVSFDSPPKYRGPEWRAHETRRANRLHSRARVTSATVSGGARRFFPRRDPLISIDSGGLSLSGRPTFTDDHKIRRFDQYTANPLRPKFARPPRSTETVILFRLRCAKKNTTFGGFLPPPRRSFSRENATTTTVGVARVAETSLFYLVVGPR